MGESVSTDRAGVDPIGPACDRFESELREGNVPRIEDYLARVDEAHRPDLLRELLAVELDWRQLAGEALQSVDYEGRFPDLMAVVQQVFARSQRIAVAAPPREADLEDDRGDAPRPGQAAPRVRFRILRVLDSGGTGDVFVALDEQLGREVALKQPQARFADDPRHRQRFEFEARITGTLEHPGIVPVYAASHRASGVPYYVSKLIRGQNLARAIHELHQEHHPWVRPHPDAQVALQRLLTRFVVVCDTVAFAHARGVIHRDLKPQNILLGEHGETLVVDWGLARRHDGQAPEGPPTAMSSVMGRGGPSPTIAELGTPGYASPEQLDGDTGAVRPASDIFALGATLYHLLTDQPPFPAGKTTEAHEHRMRAGPFPAPRSLHRRIPRALEAIVLKALAGKPQDRYGTPRELADDLERWMAGEPVSAWHEPVSVRARRFLARRPILALVLATSLLGTAGFGLYAYQKSEQERVSVETLLGSLSGASQDEVPNVAGLLSKLPVQARPRLRALRDASGSSSTVALNATLALLPIDREAAAEFEGRLRKDRHLANDLVDQLIRLKRTDSRRADQFEDLLRPVRHSLLAPLAAAVRRPPSPDDLTYNDRAARVLLVYANGAPEILADVIPDVSLDLYADYLKPLVRAPEVATERLERLLKEPLASWTDALPDQAWREPAPQLVRQIEAADGLVEPRYALCQTLPIGEFAALAEQLRPCDYRPVRVRPYRDGPTVRVAVVWTRDTLGWSLAMGLGADRVREEDRKQRAQRRWPVDVAAYIPATGNATSVPEHVIVWCDPTETRGDARLAPRGDAWERPDRDLPDAQSELRLGLDSPAAWEAAERSLAAGHRPVTRHRLRLDDGQDWLAEVWLFVPGHRQEWPVPEVGNDDALTTRLSHRACVWDLSLTLGNRPAFEPRYDATFVGGDGLECAVPHGLSPAEHRTRCQALAREDFRPVGVAASGRDEPDHIVTGSVWHRPTVNATYLSEPSPELRHARAIATLARLERPERLWDALKQRPDPTIRSFLVRDAASLEIAPDLLIARLDGESDPSARRALVLALGSYPGDAIPLTTRQTLTGKLLDEFAKHPDPGLHGATGWLLRRWELGEEVGRREQALAAPAPPRDRDWYVNRQGQTFTVVRGPVTFGMGKPVNAAEGEAVAPWHEVRIERSFAMMTTEVTGAQYRALSKDPAPPPSPARRYRGPDRYAWDPSCPMIRRTWFDAARYCNRLNEVEQVPKDQWCYLEKGDGTMSIPENYLSLTGYRLPTEAEWEFACRAGAITNWPYGRASRTLDGLAPYAWSILSDAGNRTHQVATKLPNDLGLFDMLGNAHEWCHDPLDLDTYHRREPAGGPRLDREFPSGPVGVLSNRVLRGGWFHYPADGLSATARSWNWAGIANTEDGFRVARTIR